MRPPTPAELEEEAVLKQEQGMAEWQGMHSTGSRQSGMEPEASWTGPSASHQDETAAQKSIETALGQDIEAVMAAETAQREAVRNIAQGFLETGEVTNDFKSRLTLGHQKALQTTAAAEADAMAASDEYQGTRYASHSGEGVNLPILRREEYNAEGGPNPHVMFWWKEGWKGNHTNWNELMEKVRTKLYETKDGEPKGMRRANGILKIKISTNILTSGYADVLNFNGDAVVGVPDHPDPRMRVLRNLSFAMGRPPPMELPPPMDGGGFTPNNADGWV